MNAEKLNSLAKDLRCDYPRGPRDTLSGYVIVARTLDKCRATLKGTNGEYKFAGTGYLDHLFWKFTGIDPEKFRDFVATGADDAEVARWIEQNAISRPRIEIIKWNNRMRELKISDLPDKNQQFMEEYIPKVIPPNRRVTCWFDVYDIEEKRI